MQTSTVLLLIDLLEIQVLRTAKRLLWIIFLHANYNKYNSSVKFFHLLNLTHAFIWGRGLIISAFTRRICRIFGQQKFLAIIIQYLYNYYLSTLFRVQY